MLPRSLIRRPIAAGKDARWGAKGRWAEEKEGGREGGMLGENEKEGGRLGEARWDGEGKERQGRWI